jgi:hypothetical protein
MGRPRRIIAFSSLPLLRMLHEAHSLRAGPVDTLMTEVIARVTS